MDSVDVAPALIKAGENDFAIKGGPSTVPVADALDVLNVVPSVCPLYEIDAELIICVPAGKPALTVVSKLIDVDWPNARFPPVADVAPAPSRKITQGFTTGAQVAGTFENSA